MGNNESLTKNNFGSKGWIIIIYAMYALFLNTGATVDGANATISTFANAYNWNPTVLLNFSTIAGLASLIGIALFGAVCQKIGPKKVMLITGILGGLCYWIIRT